MGNIIPDYRNGKNLVFRHLRPTMPLLYKTVASPKQHTRMRFTRTTLLSAALLAAASSTVFTSCSKKEGCTDVNATNYNPDADKNDGSCVYGDEYATVKQQIKENYANIVYASYKDAYDEAVKLQNNINSFLTTPSQSGFDACKTAWLAAREPYGQTEAYRFANGPIDAEDGPEGMLNAWPLDENYIDYVTGAANAGIINDPATYPTIDADLLESLNEKGGEANISAGYHAIEFLLWGQDDPNTSLKTPGNRPYTDYLTTGGTAANQDRRGQYLKAATELLVNNLKTMVDAWDPAKTGNYRSEFLALDNNTALQNMLTAMGTLSKSELAGERIFVALDNQDQEDEHSCFSDNTHRDIILNAQGIRNVYTGSYKKVDGTTVSGTSLKDLITMVNSTVAEEMNTLSAQSITDATAIPVPFDNALTQETVGGTGPIMTTVNTLRAQGDKIAEVATALGIQINTDLPE